jgi:hypothetical protein
MWIVESAVEPPCCQSEEQKTDVPKKGKAKRFKNKVNAKKKSLLLHLFALDFARG